MRHGKYISAKSFYTRRNVFLLAAIILSTVPDYTFRHGIQAHRLHVTSDLLLSQC